jgi:hypothetical protein
MQNRLKTSKNPSKPPQNAYLAFPEPKIDTLGGMSQDLKRQCHHHPKT